MLTRLLTKKVPYTFNRAGYYYFSRRVPADLLSHYSYPRIVQGLKTRSAQTAKSRALVAAAKLDEYWSHLRMTDPDLIGRSLLKLGYGSFARITQLDVSTATEQCITLPEALETYVTQKGAGKPKSFEAAAQRACTYLVDACGAKNLAEYTRADALSYRDHLIAKGLVGSSVSRVISSIRAVFNFAISEYALDLKNPFLGMYFDKSAGVSRRLPIPIEDIRKVQNQCRLIDDDLRWLVGLVSDTGMRLAEGAGLLKSDIILDSDIPHISLKPHPWRPLKTSGSQRDVPLVGASLWAAQRLSESFPDSPYAFPRYNRKDTTNSNSASAALNKWLHQYVPVGCTMHSFRHSMRDRLRAVECPSDVIALAKPKPIDVIYFLQGYGVDGVFAISITLIFARDASLSDAVMAGSALLAMRHFGEAIAAPLFGWIADRFGARRVFVLATFMMTIGFGLVALGLTILGALIMLIFRGALASLGPVVVTQELALGKNPIGPLARMQAWRDFGAACGPLITGYMLTLLSAEILHAAITAALIVSLIYWLYVSNNGHG